MTYKVYEVMPKSGGYPLRYVAKSATQAKRKYCREFGIRPSNLLYGVKSLTAKKIN